MAFHDAETPEDLPREHGEPIAPEPPQPKTKLTCDMSRDCFVRVDMIDNRGYLYCLRHGTQRKATTPCRLLRPSELVDLENGETIKY